MQTSNYQMGSIPGPSTAPAMRNPLQGGNATDGIKNSFAMMLARQPKATQGWQVTFNAQLRLNNLMKLFTLARMNMSQLGPATNEHLRRLGANTLEMERRFFQGCNSLDQYQQAIQRKCQDIHAQQPANPNMQPPPYMQNQPQQTGGMPNGRNFPPQNRHQPLPNGHQFPQNGYLQPSAPQAPMQQHNQQHRPPNIGPNNAPPDVRLNDDELRATIAQAQQNYDKANRDGTINHFRQMVSRLAPEKQRMLGAQGDPILMFITMRIRHDMLEEKRKSMSTQDATRPPQNDQGGRTMRTPMTGQNQPGAGGAPFDPSQFAGLQADALRSQASGDDVVPASNNQFPNGQPPLFKNMRNQPGQNFPHPNQLPPRQNMSQMPNQSRQMTDQATAQAHAQARMNQQNQAPNRTPQQDGLHGQVGGLHSDNSGRFASSMANPMATLNQPLSNQPMSTPRPPQNNQHGPSPMQSTPQPAQPTPGQHHIPDWVRMIPPVLQNIYRSMPEPMKMSANNMPPDRATAILQSMHQRHLQSGNLSGNRPQNQQNFPQPQHQTMQRAPGAGMGQPPNIDPSRQQQRPMPQPQPPGMMPQGVRQAINQFPSGRDGADALPLPRAEMARSIPGIDIPNHLSTWGAFMQWARETLPPDLQQRVIGFQQRWLINEARNRTGQQQPPAAAQMYSAQDLTKDPQFLQTPHVAYNTISEREAVRTGMVTLVNGMPRPAPPTQEQIAHFRRMPQFQGHTDHVLSQMYIQSNMQKLRTRDEPLWKETIRVQANMSQQQRNAGSQMPHQGPGFEAQPRPQQGSALNGPMHQGVPRQQQQQPPPQPPQPQYHPQAGQNFPNGAINGRPSSRQSGRAVQNAKAGPPNAQQQTAGDSKQQQAAGSVVPQPPQMQRQPKGQPQASVAPGQHQANQTPKGPNLPQMPSQEVEEYSRWKNEVASKAKNSLGEFQKRPREMISQVVEIMTTIRASQMFQALLAVAPYFWSRFKGQPTAVDLLAKHMTTVFHVQSQKPPQNMLSITPEEMKIRLREVGDFVNRARQTLGSVGAANQQPQAQQAQPVSKQQSQSQQPQQQAPEIVRQPSRQDRKNDVPPPAPTSEKAPFTFDTGHNRQHLSPDGTPRAYGSMNFDPNRISIPPQRKRKHGSESTKGTPTPQPLKPMAEPAQQPMAQRPTSPVADAKRPFRCAVPLCDEAPLGFATQEEADKHAQSVHRYHGDDLDFCLRSLRDALNLDVLGNPKQKVESKEIAGNKSAKNETAAVNIKGANVDGSRKPTTDSTPALFVKPGETIAQATKRQQQAAKATTPAVSAFSTRKSNPWQDSNITRSTLANIFTDIPDFPQRLDDPFAAFTFNYPLEEAWPADAPGRTVQEIFEDFQQAQAEKEANTAPEDIIHVRLEDYNPFPQLNGGVDPYEGKIVNIIEDDKPRQWSKDYDMLEREWCDPAKTWKEVGEKMEREEEHPEWYQDMGNPDIKAFMEGKFRDVGKEVDVEETSVEENGSGMKEEKGEVMMVDDSGIGDAEEAKEESPPKRVKVSL